MKTLTKEVGNKVAELSIVIDHLKRDGIFEDEPNAKWIEVMFEYSNMLQNEIYELYHLVESLDAQELEAFKDKRFKIYNGID